MSLVVVLIIIAVFWFLRKYLGLGMSGSKHNNSFQSNEPYLRKYNKNQHPLSSVPTPAQAKGSAQGLPECKFFLSAKKHLARDYVLVIDRSGSMSGGKWKETEKAVQTLAPYIVKFDPDGVDVLFFDHQVERINGIKNATEIGNVFKTYCPRGSTNLALALHEAFVEHFDGTRGASTILVVTDGAPDSQREVERIIRRAANSLERDEELSISFIQIGQDRGASKFLKFLDDDLTDVKFDIVDTISSTEANNISFPELIARSIYD